MADREGCAVVTGASGGIGEHLARAFAADGTPLVLVARSGETLDRVAHEIGQAHGVAVETVALDLGLRESPARLQEAIAGRGFAVRHLVNNAGFGLSGAFAGHALEAELSLLDLNMRALTELSHRFLPDIRAARGGILNVASTAAFLPGPYMASYYASKAYVLSFSVGLAHELAAEGVTVTALCPGPTATNFQSRAGMTASPLFRLLPSQSAESVARRGYAAYRRGRTVCIPGAANGLLTRLSAPVPRAITARVARFLNRGRS